MSDPDYKQLSRERFLALIDEVRSRHGDATDAQIAEYLGIEKTHISHMRRNDARGLGADVQNRIARKLGISLDYFADDRGLSYQSFLKAERATVERHSLTLDERAELERRLRGPVPEEALEWALSTPGHRLDIDSIHDAIRLFARRNA